MTKGILGRKIGMTQVFAENGDLIPVTVIEAGPCTVVQVKTKDADGYEAVQLGFGDVKESKLTKPKMGEFKKTNTTPKKHLRENDIKEKSKYNQIANFTYLDTQINKAISDKAPNIYFKEAFEQCGKEAIYGNIVDEDILRKNLEQNCIPPSITDMDCSNYEDFLVIRRKLMAQKIKAYYYSL